jgi:hypothetical protein
LSWKSSGERRCCHWTTHKPDRLQANRPLDNFLITLIILGAIAAFAGQLLVLVTTPIASRLGGLREEQPAPRLLKELETQLETETGHLPSLRTAEPANNTAFGAARPVPGSARSSFGQRK